MDAQYEARYVDDMEAMHEMGDAGDVTHPEITTVAQFRDIMRSDPAYATSTLWRNNPAFQRWLDDQLGLGDSEMRAP